MASREKKTHKKKKKKNEVRGPLRSPDLKLVSKSASAILTFLHSELVLYTFKVLFFSIKILK